MERLFQSTPSWRGRPNRIRWYLRMQGFQSTPSWRGRRDVPSYLWAYTIFQSTPSWRGRRQREGFAFGAWEISIHALVKRATQAQQNRLYTAIISIHALVKRATSFYGSFGLTAYISIHALVKRATCSIIAHYVLKWFQSTPSWRGRPFVPL